MTQEQLDSVKEGDVLISTFNSWHFEEGDTYKVYYDELSKELIVWCDEIQVHFVHSLNPKHWKLKEEE